MFRHSKIAWCFVLVCVVGLSKAIRSEQPGLDSRSRVKHRLPNIVVIFIDDLGYADIGPFGSTAYQTPHLDTMAREGRRFTDFVVSSAVCSASRSALLTGCFNQRIGIQGALFPNAKVGIHANEMTLGELCQQRGYATACFGKWHLGMEQQFLPLQHGFDYYFGLPYSNDMWPFVPGYENLPTESQRRVGFPDLPLIEGNEIVDSEVTAEDQKLLTTQYTEKAVAFINEHGNQPFLLYVPHSMIHVPLYVSEKFAGKSGVGLFGDVMLELDWSVGEIMGAIKRHQLEEDTLVVFTSDNGPWLNFGTHAGSAGPLREGKGTMFEGGYRVPTLMQWTGKIPAGTTCDELASTIDIFPTVAKLIDGELPSHKIDGKDIRPLMFGAEGAVSPHDHFACYYAGGELQAVRDRQFKLVFPHNYRSLNGRQGRTDGRPIAYEQNRAEFALYDLKSDIGETVNVAANNPTVVQRLQQSADAYRVELGDTLTKSVGSAVRPVGRLDQ